MKKSINIFFFLSGLALFAVMVYSFGISNIIYYISKTGYYFIAICGVWLFVYIINAYAWYLIINKDKISFLKLLSVSISSFAINYLTPFVNLGGEPFRVLAVKTDIGTHKAVSSTVLYNMLHILSHLFLWLSSIVLVLCLYKIDIVSLAVLLTSFLVILLGVIVFFKAHKNGLFNWTMDFTGKYKFLKKLHSKLMNNEKALHIIDREIIELFNTRKKIFWCALSLEFFSRLIMSLEFYFILNSINMEISLIDAVVINSISSLIQNILFFMPMGFGAREGSMYLIMENLGLTPMIGIYVSVINRIREFFWIFLGLILLQMLGYKKNDKSMLQYVEENND
jgi:uncharacterized protein (TIRG00374 family)